MIKFFHKLMNPHCQDCRLEEQEKHEKELEAKVCQSCESLKQQIETLRFDNKQLLDAVITKETKQETVATTDEYKPIKPRMIPWSQRKQMLEAEDRQTAMLRKKNEETNKPLVEDIKIEELEKDLGIDASIK